MLNSQVSFVCDMENTIHLITLVIYLTFIFRFILSWIGGDFDLDLDDGDLDLGDLVSFKGVNHFLMGFFGWLSTKLFVTHSLMWYDYLISFILGLIFSIILFYVYKFMMKLECKPKILSGKELINHTAKVYIIGDKQGDYYHYIITVNTGNGTSEFTACSPNIHSIGDLSVITDYDGAYYYIL